MRTRESEQVEMSVDSSNKLYSFGDGFGSVEYAMLEKHRSTHLWPHSSPSVGENRPTSLKIVRQVYQ
jgi:hypothetical protein